MSRNLPFVRRFGPDQRGLALVEFALSLPVLTALSIGTYDASRLVIQRLDLQQASTETASLIIANPPASSSDTDYIKTAAASASGLPTSKISVGVTLQCNGTAAASGTTKCATGQEQAQYVTLVMTGTYTPKWTAFGIGRTVSLPVTRVIRIQ